MGEGGSWGSKRPGMGGTCRADGGVAGVVGDTDQVSAGSAAGGNSAGDGAGDGAGRSGSWDLRAMVGSHVPAD